MQVFLALLTSIRTSQQFPARLKLIAEDARG
jgi:hypothetical protein